VAVEKVGKARRLSSLGLDQQRIEERLYFARDAVVGGKGNKDAEFRRESMDVFSECDCSERAVLDRTAGMLAAAGAELDDAVGLRFGESVQRRVDRVAGTFQWPTDANLAQGIPAHDSFIACFSHKKNG
jgi:hypothetical protein